MHTISAKLAFFLSTAIPSVVGLAFPQGATQVVPCAATVADSYTVTNKESIHGDPVIGSFSCDASADEDAEAGCTLEAGASYSVGVTVSAGVELGLDLGAISAAVNTEVSTTTETGTTSGASKNCPPGDYVCGLEVKPAMLKISGMKSWVPVDDATCTRKEEPYEVTMPLKGAGGVEGAQVDICACQNEAGWANAGAPSKLCPGPCP